MLGIRIAFRHSELSQLNRFSPFLKWMPIRFFLLLYRAYEIFHRSNELYGLNRKNTIFIEMLTGNSTSLANCQPTILSDRIFLSLLALVLERHLQLTRYERPPSRLPGACPAARTSAMRRSRSVFAAVSTALAAAFSDSLARADDLHYLVCSVIRRSKSKFVCSVIDGRCIFTIKKYQIQPIADLLSYYTLISPPDN